MLERCDALAAISEEPGRLVRRFATPALREAVDTVGGWMRDAGLAVREDGVGNLIGRRGEGPALVLGSHLDTVIDAGRYDGPLGALGAIAVVERLGERELPFALEVVAFADEEGVRYSTAFLGSSAMAGSFDTTQLGNTDAQGIAMAEAIRAYGGDPDAIVSAARAPGDLLAYCELHIEQGPVLERSGVPVGIVTTITGQNQVELVFRGEAGHAGTMPMQRRHDALAAAAEWIVGVEALARGREDMVATVGRIRVEPGARNVIPGSAALSLDLRHTNDATRRAAVDDLRSQAERIAAARDIALEWTLVGETEALPLDPDLAGRLEEAVRATGTPVARLASGAGHDGVAMSALAPVAMLFVRCEGGISHNPAEAVAEADVAVALDVLERFVVSLA